MLVEDEEGRTLTDEAIEAARRATESAYDEDIGWGTDDIWDTAQSDVRYKLEEYPKEELIPPEDARLRYEALTREAAADRAP